MTLDQIRDIQAQINACISKRVDINDGNSCMFKLEEISCFLASSSACIVHAKALYLLDQKNCLDTIYLKKESDNELKKVLSPSVVKQFVETRCIETSLLYTQCEKTHSSLVHAGDFLRSILSTIKSEMQLQGSLMPR